MSTKINWNEVNTAALKELAGASDVEVSQDRLVEIAEEMGTTSRSIGAKLRKMEFQVAKATPKASAWTEAQETELSTLVNANANELTYAEIAASFQGGAFTSKQVQGKLLNMELFDKVRKAEKKAAPRTYTPEQEAEFIGLVESGATMEVLAETFGKTIASVRGKSLSLVRSKDIDAMPKQEKSNAKESADILEGVDVATHSIDSLVELTSKSARGIKSILTRRGISCTDYDGEAKHAKLASKNSD